MNNQKLVSLEKDPFGEFEVRILWDHEWNEYVVECVRLPYYFHVSSYYTDCYKDAVDTSRLFIKEIEEGKIS